MSLGDNTPKRNLLGRQPARALLIDITHPFDQHVCHALCESLENLFAVACGISGPSRIPLVSIFLLTAQSEILLPLSSLKGNFPRIQNALKTVQTSVSEVSEHLTKDTSCIPQAVHQAIEQFKRQVCTFTQPGLSISQLEVIILSCHSGEFVSKRIEAVADTLHIQHIKRIVSVTLNPLVYGNEEGLMETGSQGSGVSTHSNSLVSGLVDTITLDADCLSLINFFYGWLMDCGSDSEHLHILLPSQYTGGQRMVLKCDMQERILNPAQLPHNTSYTLHPESATCKMVFASTSKAAGITIPVHKVNIAALILSSAICESVLFGMPLIVQPTSCWKVDWDELEKNQQNFRALCHLLQKKDLVMIGQMEHSPTQKTSIAGHSSSPCGWFVLLPGPNLSLLIKSVAVSELLLPSLETVSVTEEPSEDSLDLLETVLDKVEVWDTFNPLTLNSGLYDSLRGQPKGSRGSAQIKKRDLDQAPCQYGGGPVNKVRGLSAPSSTYTAYNTQHQQRQFHRQQNTKKPLKAFLTDLE